MAFGDLFPKTSPRPPIHLISKMTGFKQNTFLIKTCIFNANINFSPRFVLKLPLNQFSKDCIPDSEVFHTTDFPNHSNTGKQDHNQLSNHQRAAPDP